MKTGKRPFGGYHQNDIPREDEELTHVEPGTPGGEYLRRFWHPVALSQQLNDLPLAVRVLCEDLVLFRDLSGQVGLLHRACAHRGASLEYGIIAERGIRCCYHGWAFNIDGTLLEAPGEPPQISDKLKAEVCQGAYPALECKGIVFAFLGPIDEKPEFPVYDTYDIPGGMMIPYSLSYPCNWLQIRENAIDPFHTPFLHTRISGPQFQDTFGALPIIDYHASPIGFFYTNARRIGDNVWVRVHDIILPNLTQQGSLAQRGTEEKLFGRGALTKWAVPVDNTHTKVIGWRHFNERGDLAPPDAWEMLGVEKVDHFGQTGDRPYEEAQRMPGDYEAWISQGPIAIHKNETLASTDRGVAMLRVRLRKEIRAVKAGKSPKQPADMAPAPIPTYAGDTVVREPARPGIDDRELILKVSRRVVAAITGADHLTGNERYKHAEQLLMAD